MKQHSKFLVVSTILILIFLLLGCITISNKYQERESYEVIFIPKQIDESNNFWSAVVEGVNMAAREYEVDLRIVSGASEEDIKGQNKLIEWAIKEKPDALIVAPCSYTESTKLLKKVKEAGVCLVLLDSVVDEPVADLVIATDNIKAGRELGIYAKDVIESNKGIGIIGHVQNSSTAIQREKGIRSALGENEDIIKEVVFCGSDYGKAYDQAVELIEKYPDLEMIIGLNEYSAVGAARAIRDLKMQDHIKLIGFDSSIEAIQLMEEGIYSGIIIQKPLNMGYLALEQLVLYLNKGNTKAVLDAGCKLITIDNLYSEENQKLLFPFVENQNNPK